MVVWFLPDFLSEQCCARVTEPKVFCALPALRTLRTSTQGLWLQNKTLHPREEEGALFLDGIANKWEESEVSKVK